MDCKFCQIKEWALENSGCYAVFDKYPVNKGHILIITKRHFSNYFDAKENEILEVNSLILDAKLMVDKLHSPDGYNIGVNCGETAGQTIMHFHVHLIPRYANDVADPTGGVRGVIPDKQKY